MRKIERALPVLPPVTFSPQSMKQCQVPLGVAYLAAAVEGYGQEERTGQGYFRYGRSLAEIEQRIQKVLEVRRRLRS